MSQKARRILGIYAAAAIAIIVLVANLVIMLGYNRVVETRARRALG